MPGGLAYRTDRFAKVFHEQQGSPLWTWLQQEENITIMATASYLHRPPVEALAPGLTQRFPRVMRSRSGRQMTGHMIRQIMESQGFHLDRSNVKISRPGNPFRRGSTYTA